MKNYVKLILLLAVLASTAAKAQTTTYREIYDEPLSYKKLFVSLHILNMDVASPNNFRFGAGAEFMLNKRLWFSADVDKVFNEKLFSTVYGAVKRGSFSAEAGMVFNFRAKVRKGKIVYHWRERSGINQATEYKLKIDGNVLRTTGVRGGLFTFSSAKDLGYYKAYFTTGGLYAGIIFGAIRNKRIESADIASRHTVKETKGVFYIDALFSPVVSYSDNTDYDGVDAKAFNLSKNTNMDTLVTKKYIGVRIGWLKTFRYPVPLSYGFEAGMRPGLQKNYFFLAKIAISVGFIGGRPRVKG